MTVQELMKELGKLPPDFPLTFNCPDGFSDTVDHAEVDGGEVMLSGYMHWLREEKKK